jgi:hypothetical protein
VSHLAVKNIQFEHSELIDNFRMQYSLPKFRPNQTQPTPLPGHDPTQQAHEPESSNTGVGLLGSARQIEDASAIEAG